MNRPASTTALLLPWTLAFIACQGDLAVAKNGPDGGLPAPMVGSPSDRDAGTLADPPAESDAGCLSCSSDAVAMADAVDDAGDSIVSQPAVHPAACLSTCSTPAGTVQPLSSPEEVYQVLVGRWQICPGASGTPFPGPSDMIGVEYGPASFAPTAAGSTVGGNMYYLVQGPSGPVRGSGFDYQLTYDVSPEGASSFQLNMHPGSGGFGGYVRYSPCPAEISITDTGGGAVLVPVE